MILGHYIVGIGSYNTTFDFPKDAERNFKSEAKILENFNFWSKNANFYQFFDKKFKILKIFVSDLKFRSVSFGKSKEVLQLPIPRI